MYKLAWVCVCLFGHKTTCVFVLVFLSFWQLNARVFVKKGLVAGGWREWISCTVGALGVCRWDGVVICVD